MLRIGFLDDIKEAFEKSASDSEKSVSSINLKSLFPSFTIKSDVFKSKTSEVDSGIVEPNIFTIGTNGKPISLDTERASVVATPEVWLGIVDFFSSLFGNSGSDSKDVGSGVSTFISEKTNMLSETLKESSEMFGGMFGGITDALGGLLGGTGNKIIIVVIVIVVLIVLGIIISAAIKNNPYSKGANLGLDTAQNLQKKYLK